MTDTLHLEPDDDDETAPAKLSPEELFVQLDDDSQQLICLLIARMRSDGARNHEAHQG